jgi:hypothetical protein
MLFYLCPQWSTAPSVLIFMKLTIVPHHYVPTSHTKFHIVQTINADSKDRNSFGPLRMALTMPIFIKMHSAHSTGHLLYTSLYKSHYKCRKGVQNFIDAIQQSTDSTTTIITKFTICQHCYVQILYNEFYPNVSKNTERMGRNFHVFLNEVWLSVTWLARNSHLSNNFL